MKEVISFELSGDYGLFKKPWCNREQQSFLIPPKTSIVGLLSAIIGLDKKEYLEKISFSDVKYGVEVLETITREMHGINFMHGRGLSKITKKLSNPYRNPSSKGSISPTRLEYLKNPKYLIYLRLENDLFERLKQFLMEEKCVFPPSLGQTNLFAKICDYKVHNLNIKAISETSCAVPSEFVDVEKLKGKFFTERIPISMDMGRSNPKYLSLTLKNSKSGLIPIKKNKKIVSGELDNGKKIVLF